MQLKYLSPLFSLLFLACAGAACAADIHVPADYSTIQAAVDAASPGDNVVLAPGTYYGTGNVNVTFGGKAVTVKNTDGHMYESIIDCQWNARAFLMQSGEGAGTVIHGLAITNGYSGVNDVGGAIVVSNASPTIEWSRFSNCYADYQGGAIDAEDSHLHVQYCNFDSDTSNNDGGAVLIRRGNAQINNSTFANCLSYFYGDAIAGEENAQVTVRQCEFDRNHGLIAVFNCSSISQSTFFENNWGVYFDYQYCNTPTNVVSDCTFIHNSQAGVLMEACSNLVCSNCSFSRNQASGFVCDNSQNLVVTNCSFSNNTYTGMRSDFNAGAICLFAYNQNLQIRNSVLWGNQDPVIGESIYYGGTSNWTVTNCDVQGGASGTGNINVDPKFVSPSNDDLHILSSSPCVNSGSNAFAPTNQVDPGKAYVIDLDGFPRISGGTVDMGAYEIQGPPAPVTTSRFTGPAGLNGWYRDTTFVYLNSTVSQGYVQGIYYTVDGGQTTAGTVITLSRSGVHTVTYWATSTHHATESAHTMTIMIDKDKPVLSDVADLPVITAGVYENAGTKTKNVTFSGLASDLTSGIDVTSGTFSVYDSYGLCHPTGSFTINPDGTYSFVIPIMATIRFGVNTDARYRVTFTVKDIAGNTTSVTTSVGVKVNVPS